MPRHLDPLEDFQDDGGTPMWRRRHMPHPRIRPNRVIEVRQRGLRAWWRNTHPVVIYIQIVGGFIVFAATLMILLLIEVAIYAAVTG